MTDAIGISLVVIATAAVSSAAAVVVLNRRQTQSAASAQPILHAAARPTTEPAPAAASLPWVLVDTSAIIDGRIADIAAAGFAPGQLVVPRFVLAELQNIADSEDAMRRSRGRRGLEVLGRLRELPGVGVQVIDDDVSGMKEVDAKLVVLAQRFGCKVLTTDYNLNQVAGIQGVRVLNVNELSNAIRPVVLPGEPMQVRIVQPGKERNQGVGYLTDGTMIVVENGDKLIGRDVVVEVTRVFQTVAGKMIFAAVQGQAGQIQPAQPATPEDNLLKAIADSSTGQPAGLEAGSGQAADAAKRTPGAPRHRGRGRGHRNGGQNRPTPTA